MARGLVRSVESADQANTSEFDRFAAQGATLSALIAFAGWWKKPSPPWRKMPGTDTGREKGHSMADEDAIQRNRERLAAETCEYFWDICASAHEAKAVA